MSGIRTHGHTAGAAAGRKASREYHSWCAMRTRCENEKSAKYPRYGGRGITVCERWQRFQNFIEDMGPAPPGMTLDRINGDGNYEPGNCRWATAKQQSANRAPFVNSHSLKTHCPSGHAYEGDNVRHKGNTRRCRSCDRIRARAARAAVSAAKAKARAWQATRPPEPVSVRAKLLELDASNADGLVRLAFDMPMAEARRLAPFLFEHAAVTFAR
jgi:hypothetical protein